MTNYDFAAIGIETTHEWVDGAHRHLGAPHRRSRGQHVQHGREGRAHRDAARGRAARRDRHDHLQHRHSRPSAPRHGRRHPGEPRRLARGGVRHLRGVLRISLRTDDGRGADPERRGGDGAARELRKDERDHATGPIAPLACSSAMARAPRCCAVRRRGAAFCRRSCAATARSRDLLYRPAGGAATPMSPAVLEARTHLVHMAGREVFKHAVRSMAESADRALDMRAHQRRRHRSAHSAPGESAHHRGDREAREHPDEQGVRERGPLREHVIRIDSDRARRGDRRRGSWAKARSCSWWRSAPASPGRRRSCASDERSRGHRAALSRTGIAEGGNGKGSRRGVSLGEGDLRAGRRDARIPALPPLLRGSR